jgi:hypothetical protein
MVVMVRRRKMMMMNEVGCSMEKRGDYMKLSFVQRHVAARM